MTVIREIYLRMYWSQYVPSQASKNPLNVDIQERLKKIFSFEYIKMRVLKCFLY